MSRAASAHSSGNSSDEGTTSRAVGMGAEGGEAKGSRAPSSVGKKSKKRDKEAKKELQRALANAKIWETRLDVCERSRLEYRSTAKRLVMENEDLRGQMKQTERDTIDVITYLKKEDQTKDEQIFKLQLEMKRVRADTKRDKAEFVESCNQKILQLEEELEKKTQELEVMKGELKLVKEFRRKRAAMQKELDDIKDAFHATNKEHKSKIQRMEQKFFEEKMRLQQEANQKIAELAERAHTEAIKNLDETTRDVYKENVRANEALSYHMTKGDDLDKLKTVLIEENHNLKEEKEIHSKLIEDRVKQAKDDRETIKTLREKVETLERSLNQMVMEFERDRQMSLAAANRDLQMQSQECERLNNILQLKCKELEQIKRLGRRILQQRSEVETFFLTALEEVRNEIAVNRSVYVRESRRAYTARMAAAAAGRDSFPRVRTFTKGNPMTSANTVFQDLEQAQDLSAVKQGPDIAVDISELSWEQKEKVLRSLFAMMNGLNKSGSKASGFAAASAARPSPSILDPIAQRRRIPSMKPLQHLAIESGRRGEGAASNASNSTEALLADMQQSVNSNFSGATTPRISGVGGGLLEASVTAGGNNTSTSEAMISAADSVPADVSTVASAASAVPISAASAALQPEVAVVVPVANVAPAVIVGAGNAES